MWLVTMQLRQCLFPYFCFFPRTERLLYRFTRRILNAGFAARYQPSCLGCTPRRLCSFLMAAHFGLGLTRKGSHKHQDSCICTLEGGEATKCAASTLGETWLLRGSVRKLSSRLNQSVPTLEAAGKAVWFGLFFFRRLIAKGHQLQPLWSKSGMAAGRPAMAGGESLQFKVRTQISYLGHCNRSNAIDLLAGISEWVCLF